MKTVHIFQKYAILTFTLIICLLVQSCEKKKSGDQTETQTKLEAAPVFNGDSAFAFVKKQVDFGPRVPGSAAHQKTGDFIVSTLKSFQLSVVEQPFTATLNGAQLKGRNIIGSYNPTATKRIILASHWDSRPYADQDSAANKTKPVPAANDGASGVGVLLEIARALSGSSVNVGVDLIFFDLEDMGKDEYTDEFGGYLLGSKYWAKNFHTPGYSAYFGILLDMVGAKGAIFPKEGNSMQYARDLTNNIWNIASRLGYDSHFVNTEVQGIIDDHVPVNTLAKIPMVDIIHLQINNPQKTFFDHWHTTHDALENIDPKTLKAVGQTVIQVVVQTSIDAI